VVLGVGPREYCSLWSFSTDNENTLLYKEEVTLQTETTGQRNLVCIGYS
jgi:hypothetical protein